MTREDIYKSSEWKELDPMNRASILLVAEGLKPGSTFGSKYRTDLENVLDKLNLPYSEPERFKGKYIYTIARDEKTLRENIRNSLDERVTATQFHRAKGKFYGFPECCTDSQSVSEIYRDKNSKRKRLVSFDKILKDYEKKNGSYPEELDYRMMVPCNVKCSNATKLLGNHRDVLQKYDPEAAKVLADFNRTGYRIIKRPNR